MLEKCLVTGSNGHLGNNLVRELIQNGFKVRASTRNMEYLDPYHNLDCELVYADILDKQSLLKAMKGIDTLYHVAAVFKHWSKDPVKDIIDPNIQGVKNVLEAAYKNNVKKIVFVSSIAAVDQTQKIITEDTWSHQFPNPYFKAKKIAEELAWELAKEYNLNMVSVLPSGMTGSIIFKHLPPAMNFLKMTISNQLKFDPNFTINYVHVQDVAKGMIAAASKGLTGERYLLTTEYSTPTKRVFEIAREFRNDLSQLKPYGKAKLKSLAFIMEAASKITGTPPLLLRGNIDHYYNANHSYDISKSQKHLGYSPRDPENAIREVFAAWI